MEWLESIGAVAGGGLFGFLGSIVSQFGKAWQEKQRQEWEKQKWQHKENMHKLNMQMQSQQTEQEIALANTSGSWKGMHISHESVGKPGPTHMWVSDIKALFRPFLTVLLWSIAAYLFYFISSKGLTALTQAEVNELVKYMVYSVFFTASTSAIWWYGDRALTPPGMK